MAADQEAKQRLFRVGDLVLVFVFVGLGILLIFAAISISSVWKASTLSWQFLGL